VSSTNILFFNTVICFYISTNRFSGGTITKEGVKNMDISYTRAFNSNGEEITIPVEVKKCGKYYFCRIKKEDMLTLNAVDIVPQLTSTYESDGFIVAPYGLNCILFTFNDRETIDNSVSMPTVLFTGAHTEKGTYLVLIEGGMKEEVVYHLERNKGFHLGCFRLQFKEDKFSAYDDITFRVYELFESADYNDMAKLYRAFKRENGLKSIIEKNREAVTYCAVAPEIRVRMAWKPVPSPVALQNEENEPPVFAAVTFDRLMEFMLALKKSGIDRAELCLVGWNKGGHDGRYPQIFPVEETLGGEARLREAIKLAKELGYKIVCHTNSTDAYSIADTFDEKDLISYADGKKLNGFEPTWGGGLMHRICAVRALEQARELLPRVKELGFSGVHYIDVLSVIRPYYCYDESHPCTRHESVRLWTEIIDLARDLFGGIGSEGTFDMLGDKLDFALYSGFGKFKNKALAEDKDMKLIPLWELVYHGSITGCPSSELVNISLTAKAEQLKFIEYGGRPAMYVNSRFVTETEKRKNWMGDNDIRLGTEQELENGVRAVKSAYDMFEPLAYLQYEFMEEHKEIARDVFRITYSDGSKIYVNYNNECVTADGVLINGTDYLLVKGKG